mgnify:CR=1 FL=1
MDSNERYRTQEIEPRWQKVWANAAMYQVEPVEDKPKFYTLVMFPYPSGDLHMGHALQVATQDTLIRYHRMLGRRTKFILGTDHAGIGTQMQVEKQLAREGTSREAIGRQAFLERIWAWKPLRRP